MPSFLELSGGYGVLVQPQTGSGILGCVNQALLELKLPEVSAVFGNTDTDVSLMRATCSRVADMLLKAHDWPQLEQVGTITTAADTATYQLPHDVNRIIPDTVWDRANNMQVRGPDTSQDDRARQDGRNPLAAPFKIYRKLGGLMQIVPTPTAIETISFSYISSNIALQGGVTPTRYITADQDEVLFDKWLFVSWLKAYFLKSNGFDDSMALAEANTLLQAAKNAGGSSAAFNLGTRVRDREMIGPHVVVSAQA